MHRCSDGGKGGGQERGWGARAVQLGQSAGLLHVMRGLRSGSGQHLAIPIPLLQECGGEYTFSLVTFR